MVMCNGVPGLNCGSDDKVVITKICGVNVEAKSSARVRRRLASDSEVYFSLIFKAVADADLRQKDALMGQYLTGSNLETILTDIRTTTVSTTTTTTLGAITAMYYTFVDSLIRGLGLYYADWGKSNTCINDGNQEDYMNDNPSQWMYTNLADCCYRFFSWDVIKCLSSDPTYEDPTSNLYYADWRNSDTCINDGNAPEYMKRASSVWMHSTLVDCCRRYFSWSLNECIVSGGGNAPTQSPVDTTEIGWYVHYPSMSCVKNCEDQDSSCGGSAKKWDYLYSSEVECCQKRLWWLGDKCFK
jgi:hypothetical protein